MTRAMLAGVFREQPLLLAFKWGFACFAAIMQCFVVGGAKADAWQLMNDMPMREPKLRYVAQPAVWAMAKGMHGKQAVPCGGQVSTKCIGMSVRQGLPPTRCDVFCKQACEERER